MILQWDRVPHTKHRYRTVGDWYWCGDILRIFSSQLSDRRYEILVLYHETTEALLCEQAGISESDVMAFDLAYEECRRLKLDAPCGCSIDYDSEPGEDDHSPYRLQHETATACEKLMARALSVSWIAYQAEIESL